MVPIIFSAGNSEGKATLIAITTPLILGMRDITRLTSTNTAGCGIFTDAIAAKPKPLHWLVLLQLLRVGDGLVKGQDITTYAKKSDISTSISTTSLTVTGETSVPTANAGNSSNAIASTENGIFWYF